MSTAARRRKLAKKCKTIIEEAAIKHYNQNPKQRKNGQWLKAEKTN